MGGKEKSPQRTERQWCTQLSTCHHDATPERGGEGTEMGPGVLFLCLLLRLLFGAAKQAGWKFIFGPLHTASQICSPFSSNPTKAVSASILCAAAQQLKAKILGCSVSKRQRGAGFHGPMGKIFKGIKGGSSFVEISSDGGRCSWLILL